MNDLRTDVDHIIHRKMTSRTLRSATSLSSPTSKKLKWISYPYFWKSFSFALFTSLETYGFYAYLYNLCMVSKTFRRQMYHPPPSEREVVFTTYDVQAAL